MKWLLFMLLAFSGTCYAKNIFINFIIDKNEDYRFDVKTLREYTIPEVSRRFFACSNSKYNISKLFASRYHRVDCQSINPKKCNDRTWMDKIDRSKADHNVYILSPICSRGCALGLGEVYGTNIWLRNDSAYDPMYYLHELGHNLGLDHASIVNSCEYCDASSPMGYCCAERCFNAPQTHQLKWGRRVKTIQYQNIPFNTWIKEPMSFYPLDYIILRTKNNVYFLSTRRREGSDKGLPLEYANRLLIHNRTKDSQTFLLNGVTGYRFHFTNSPPMLYICRGNCSNHNITTAHTISAIETPYTNGQLFVSANIGVLAIATTVFAFAF